jgi:hypothetical protein
MEILSIDSAITIQCIHLTKWRRVLLPQVYNELEIWATANNHLKRRGEDIIRGCDLDMFISNYGIYTPPN